jgi:hypothetical protein
MKTDIIIKSIINEIVDYPSPGTWLDELYPPDFERNLLLILRLIPIGGILPWGCNKELCRFPEGSTIEAAVRFSDASPFVTKVIGQGDFIGLRFVPLGGSQDTVSRILAGNGSPKCVVKGLGKGILLLGKGQGEEPGYSKLPIGKTNIGSTFERRLLEVTEHLQKLAKELSIASAYTEALVGSIARERLRNQAEAAPEAAKEAAKAQVPTPRPQDIWTQGPPPASSGAKLIKRNLMTADCMDYVQRTLVRECLRSRRPLGAKRQGTGLRQGADA